MSKIIVIDPGHGGYDPGAVHGTAQEKDFTLHIGMQVRDLLQKAGFQVIMTRTTDNSPGGFTEVNADLNERCRIANTAKADVFLSIHVNAGGGNGAEIYADGDGGQIAGLAKSIIDNVSTICGVHGQAVRDGGSNGSGWRVICGTNMDAMLVEVGFIDSDDLSKIEAHQDDFAPLIAKAFCEFYGVAYPDEKVQMQTPTVLTVNFTTDAAQKVINDLGALYQASADLDVQKAAHYAADQLRLVAGIIAHSSIDTAFGAVAAQKVINDLGTLYVASADSNVQAAAHFAAQKLRIAKGLS